MPECFKIQVTSFDPTDTCPPPPPLFNIASLVEQKSSQFWNVRWIFTSNSGFKTVVLDIRLIEGSAWKVPTLMVDAGALSHDEAQPARDQNRAHLPLPHRGKSTWSRAHRSRCGPL